jgi:hypothetical protein
LKKRPSTRPEQKIARARLLTLHDELKSWRRVGGVLGMNCGQAWKIAYGKRKATRGDLAKLEIHAPRKPRIPWKKKYHLLRLAITQRRVN